MIKYIYSILLVVSCLMVPVTSGASAMPSIEIIDQEQQAVVSVTNDNILHVSNANGQVVYIYNVAGVVVHTLKVEGMDRSYELNLQKGCYIIKVAKTVRKVYIR